MTVLAILIFLATLGLGNRQPMKLVVLELAHPMSSETRLPLRVE
jgi:hypothetical protein